MSEDDRRMHCPFCRHSDSRSSTPAPVSEDDLALLAQTVEEARSPRTLPRNIEGCRHRIRTFEIVRS